MKSYFLLTITWVILTTSISFAGSVYLEPGETFTSENVNVKCVETKPLSLEPVSIKDCQYWDDFNKKCLYEKTTYTAGDITCVDKCQHWDDFNKKCQYETSCRFEKASNVFIITTCYEFDRFTGKCLREKESKPDPN